MRLRGEKKIMKGAIIDCLKEMITKCKGEEKWTEILLNAGFSPYAKFPHFFDIPEEYFQRIYQSISKTLAISHREIGLMFGDYFINVYSQIHFKKYYSNVSTLKDFLLKMDYIHRKVTEEIPYAKPPHFEYEKISENELKMSYFSSRNLVDFYEGLILGSAKFFREEIEIKKISPNSFIITF